jgi:hypothetical protein
MTKLGVFALVAIIQLAIPISMIFDAERTLVKGKVLRFRTAPVDPADLFRGRYVRLEFAPLYVDVDEGESYSYDEIVYARFGIDSEGFSHPISVQEDPPDSGIYIPVCARGHDRDTRALEVALPVDRFYMEESLAPIAERNFNRRGDQKAWADLRVRKGHTLVEQVFIGGVPLAQVARQAATE